MADPRGFPLMRRGERLTASRLNDLVVDGMNTMRALQNIFGNAGASFQEPAGQIDVINTSDESIPALAPLALELPVQTTAPGLLNSRAFRVVRLEDSEESSPQLGIAVNEIPPGAGGRAYISGMCSARINDDNAAMIPAAGATILWEEDVSDGDRFAILRFGGGAAPQNSHLYRLIGGNILNGSGEIGIKKMSSTIASITVVPDFSAATPTTLPDGLGWAVRLDNPNQYIIVINDARALTTYDLSAPCDIFTNYSVSVLDNNGDPFDAFIAVSPI